MDESKVRVKSLQKALSVLNCFIEKQTLGVTEISEKLGLYKSNVHNILMTFVAMNYLEQDAESGKFRLGNSIFLLYKAISDGYGITDVVYPYMQKMMSEIGETIYLSVPHEKEVIYLEAAYPKIFAYPTMELKDWRAGMHCTASGKVMLAFMSRQRAEDYLNGPLQRYTEYTITDREVLRKELELIRQKRYALDNMELELGRKCVAVPLFNRRGRLEGAISASGIAMSMTKEKIEEAISVLNKYLPEISQKL
ncbi:MAG: IclR family transcriptional regulator [Johnsonella sp.]|nr:IclR family transcriptional regulator [Johnsonella sp.]